MNVGGELIRKHFSVFTALALVAGCLAYVNLAWILGFFVLGAVALGIFFKKRSMNVCLMLGFFLAVSVFSAGYYGVRLQSIDYPLEHEEWQEVQMKVITVPELKNDRMYFTARVPEKGVKVAVSAPRLTLRHPLEYGHLIVVKGRFEKAENPRNPGAFDYRKYLMRQGIAGKVKAHDIVITGRGFRSPLMRIATFFREKFWHVYQSTLPAPYDALYMGLIFGDKGVELPEKWDYQFRRLGLSHLLVVSGSQVALLSGVCLAIIRSFGLPRQWVFCLIGVINACFYLMTGGGPSIFRAVLMFQFVLGLSLMRRHFLTTHIIAVTLSVLILVNPLQLFDIGAQLSFLATIALVFVSPVISAALPNHWPQFIRESLGVSIAPYLCTFPLLWVVFHQISFISPLTNLVAVFIVELLVTLGFFSSILGLVFVPISLIMNTFALYVMKLLVWAVDLISQLSMVDVSVLSPPLFVIGGVYFLIAVLVLSLKKEHKLGIISSLGGIIVIVLVSLFIAALPSSELRVIMLDVGQGDAMLVLTPKNKAILIDAGVKNLYGDQGKRVVLPAIRALGVNALDLVIVTHFDGDHVGGIPIVLERVKVGQVMDNGSRKNGYEAYYSQINQKKIKRILAKEGQKLLIEKDLVLHILHPYDGSEMLSENDQSIVIKMSYKEVDFLLTGDLESEMEYALVEKYGSVLQSEVLKAGHHGSTTSTTAAFLKAVQPEIVLVSAGRNNRYGHPSKQILERIRTFGLPLYRTDTMGAVDIITDGKNVSIDCWKMAPCGRYFQTQLHTYANRSGSRESTP